jgi:hypothetical protein
VLQRTPKEFLKFLINPKFSGGVMKMRKKRRYTRRRYFGESEEEAFWVDCRVFKPRGLAMKGEFYICSFDRPPSQLPLIPTCGCSWNIFRRKKHA